ncbi:HVA22-like protein a [Zea mays]|uniref:HVA22-like protein a n=1 Tax=Zea mays TaxID=4577 RepID=A0A1D6HKG4_MAIZE|nr:HVA22-like protein a [Zea mays]AQK74917.1 HVA22-like protein a [Zea mays]
MRRSLGHHPNVLLIASLIIFRMSWLPWTTIFFSVSFCRMAQESNQKQQRNIMLAGSIKLFSPKNQSFLVLQIAQNKAPQPKIRRLDILFLGFFIQLSHTSSIFFGM